MNGQKRKLDSEDLAQNSGNPTIWTQTFILLIYNIYVY